MELPSRAHNAECRQRTQLELNKNSRGTGAHQARKGKNRGRQEAEKRGRRGAGGGMAPPPPAAPPVPGGEAQEEQLVLQDRVPADSEMAAGEAVGEPLIDADISDELKRREYIERS